MAGASGPMTGKDPWSKLTTESSNSRSRSLDTMSGPAISRLIASEDVRAIKAVSAAAHVIARVAAVFASSIVAGGRVVYIGAGTSGRMGVIDAAELVPTFGLPRRGAGSAIGIIAGGHIALRQSVEGAEDNRAGGADAIKRLKLSGKDLVIGISASSLAPFVRAALMRAKKDKAATTLVTMNKIVKPAFVDFLIAVPVGPEVLAGSTRMKAGIATKSILHNISTTAMILAGKVFGNRMVDLRMWCSKLEARGLRLVVDLGGVSERAASKLIAASRGDIKAAIVMARHGCNTVKAAEALKRSDGNLRIALSGVIR